MDLISSALIIILYLTNQPTFHRIACIPRFAHFCPLHLPRPKALSLGSPKSIRGIRGFTLFPCSLKILFSLWFIPGFCLSVDVSFSAFVIPLLLLTVLKHYSQLVSPYSTTSRNINAYSSSSTPLQYIPDSYTARPGAIYISILLILGQ